MCSVVSNYLQLSGCSLPGHSIHEISLTRILGWVAISFQAYLPTPGSECLRCILQADSLPWATQRGKEHVTKKNLWFENVIILRIWFSLFNGQYKWPVFSDFKIVHNCGSSELQVNSLPAELSGKPSHNCGKPFPVSKEKSSCWLLIERSGS